MLGYTVVTNRTPRKTGLELKRKKRNIKLDVECIGHVLLPAIVFNHMCQFNDVFPLFILLAQLKGMFIFPAKGGFTAFTENVSNSMETCQQDPLFRWAASNIDN